MTTHDFISAKTFSAAVRAVTALLLLAAAALLLALVLTAFFAPYARAHAHARGHQGRVEGRAYRQPVCARRRVPDSTPRITEYPIPILV